MENANPSCSTSNIGFLGPKKKREIESWLGDNKIIDTLVDSDDIEYFDTPHLRGIRISRVALEIPQTTLAYIDPKSPINAMSKQHYNGIMNRRLESRQKPSNPSKNNNFVGRVRGIKVFVGNFTYKCSFVILKDTTSIIDHRLGEVVFEKAFVERTGLVYNREKGMVTFEKDNENITFRMPHKMKTFNHLDFNDVHTDSIPPIVLENNDDLGKTYYSDSLTLGPEYKEDESISKEIRHLIKLEREAKRNKREVTYLAFGRHLEEIQVTWAHLEKKRTRLRTNIKSLEDMCSQSLETTSPTLHDVVATHLVTASQHFMTASARTDSHADLEDSTHDGVTIKLDVVTAIFLYIQIRF
ncbi:hypothetical protein Tco_0298598 [Tanacetum coccineum]